MARKSLKLIRAWRLLRLLAHVVRGTLITLIIFPSASRATRRQHVQRWAAQLLKILHIELEVVGKLPLCPALVVSNHISWVDIFVLDAMRPLRFVSKAEVADWPLIGRLAGAAETLYIERENTRAIAHVVESVTRALQDGDCLCIFPEGTTGSGEDVKRFHASFFESAIKSGVTLVPLTIAYTNRAGERQDAFAYIDEMSLVHSLGQILNCAESHVRVTVSPPLQTATGTRRDLALAAHAVVSGALNQAYRTRLETAHDLPTARH